MTWIDIILALFLLAMIIGGLARGTIRAIWGLVVLVVSTLAAGQLYPFGVGALAQFIESLDVRSFISFAVIYGIVSAVLNIPVEHFTGGGGFSMWGLPDHLVGGFLELIEGIGFIEVAALVLARYPIFGLDAFVRGSALVRTLVAAFPFAVPLLPPEIQAIAQALR
jgi:uncharacterized membrane protein required for colicin V production